MAATKESIPHVPATVVESVITTTTISPPTVEAILVKVYDIKTWIKYFQESVSWVD